MNNLAVENPERNQPTNLLTLIAQGNKQAEHDLVDKYWRGVLFILNKRTQDQGLAADLAQDTFIVVIEHARQGKIESPEALSGYIRQTAVNLMIAYYRKQERRATDADADIQSYVADQAPCLTQALHSRKLFSQVQQLINEMSNSRYQDILRHHFILGKDKAEVCAQLEVSPEHFDRVLYRARERLKQLILHQLNKQDSDYKDILQLLILIPFFASNDFDPKNKLNFLVGGNLVTRHLVNEPARCCKLPKGILDNTIEIREQAHG